MGLRLGVADCGSHTLYAMVAEEVDWSGEPLGLISEAAETVRLGDHIGETGQLNPEAIARTNAFFDRSAERFKAMRCDIVAGVGTEALRRATNGHVIEKHARAVFRRLGGTFEVVRADREAELSWYAVKGAFPSLKGRRTVLDIGGGSVQIASGDEELHCSLSLPIGAMRLRDAYVKADPPTRTDRRALEAAIDEALDQVPHPWGELIGVDILATSIAALSNGLGSDTCGEFHDTVLGLDAIREVIARFEREGIHVCARALQLEAELADVAYTAAVIFERALLRTTEQLYLVCDRGLCWGLAYECLAARRASRRSSLP